MGSSLTISALELREKYPPSRLCTPPPAVLSQTRRTKAVQSLGEGASQASQPGHLWAVSELRGPQDPACTGGHPRSPGQEVTSCRLAEEFSVCLMIEIALCADTPPRT